MSGYLSTDSLVRIENLSDAPRLYEVHWVITRRCTYSCSYCPPHRHNPASFEATPDQLQSATSRLGTLLKGMPTRLNITGGEPTRHPGILKFLHTVFQFPQFQFLRIVTNLSMPLPFYTRMSSIGEANSGRLQIVCSYHFEQARSQPFIDRLTVLLGGGLDVLVKLVIPQEISADYRSLLDQLASLGARYGNLIVRPQRVRGTDSAIYREATRLTTRKSDKWFDRRLVVFGSRGSESVDVKEDFDDVIARGGNDFFGWSCEAGLASLFIDNDGTVYSALCKPDPSPIYNLFTSPVSELFLPGESLICPHHLCECSASIRIPKRRIYPVGGSVG